MPKPPSGLTLEDLHALTRIVKGEPTSHKAAADLIGFNRQRLSRLIDRVNERIGEKLEWKHDSRFAVPPEARRLAAAFAGFETVLDDVLKGSPRVSAGTTASLLLARFLNQSERVLPRLILLFRSVGLIEALDRDEIDIAFAHGDSVGFTPSPDGRDPCVLRPGGVSGRQRRGRTSSRDSIEATAVLEWKATIIRPRLALQYDSASYGDLEWEAGSAGSRLAGKLETSPTATPHFRIRCRSFLEAMEFVRRGLARQAVVPDIFLQRTEPTLIVQEPRVPYRGQLVAVYRSADRVRWEWLLDPARWQKLRLDHGYRVEDPLRAEAGAEDC